MTKEVEESKVSREAAADRLETLATAIRDGDSVDVTLNNRTIHLTPPSDVGLHVGVRERSTLLRGNRESVTVTVDWKPR